ncbi:hypothetical protein Nmel_010269 [Mimus melanotis]
MVVGGSGSADVSGSVKYIWFAWFR